MVEHQNQTITQLLIQWMNMGQAEPTSENYSVLKLSFHISILGDRILWWRGYCHDGRGIKKFKKRGVENHPRLHRNGEEQKTIWENRLSNLEACSEETRQCLQRNLNLLAKSAEEMELTTPMSITNFKFGDSFSANASAPGISTVPPQIPESAAKSSNGSFNSHMGSNAPVQNPSMAHTDSYSIGRVDIRVDFDALNQKENKDLLNSNTVETKLNVSEALAHALQEKVAALLLYRTGRKAFTEKNVNATLQKKIVQAEISVIANEISNEISEGLILGTRIISRERECQTIGKSTKKAAGIRSSGGGGIIMMEEELRLDKGEIERKLSQLGIWNGEELENEKDGEENEIITVRLGWTRSLGLLWKNTGLDDKNNMVENKPLEIQEMSSGEPSKTAPKWWEEQKTIWENRLSNLEARSEETRECLQRILNLLAKSAEEMERTTPMSKKKNLDKTHAKTKDLRDSQFNSCGVFNQILSLHDVQQKMLKVSDSSVTSYPKSTPVQMTYKQQITWEKAKIWVVVFGYEFFWVMVTCGSIIFMGVKLVILHEERARKLWEFFRKLIFCKGDDIKAVQKLVISIRHMCVKQISVFMPIFQPATNQNTVAPQLHSANSKTVTNFNFGDSFSANAYSAPGISTVPPQIPESAAQSSNGSFNSHMGSNAPVSSHVSAQPQNNNDLLGVDFDALNQKEKVAALLLLSQQEERHLLEKNVNATLQKKIGELHKNLIQVTNEKVKALRELAQFKRRYQLLQTKISNERSFQGKGNVITIEEVNKESSRNQLLKQLTDREFTVGEEVYLKLQPYHLLKRKIGKGRVPSIDPPEIMNDGQLKVYPAIVLNKRMVEHKNQTFPYFDPWGQGSSGGGGIVMMEEELRLEKEEIKRKLSQLGIWNGEELENEKVGEKNEIITVGLGWIRSLDLLWQNTGMGDGGPRVDLLCLCDRWDAEYKSDSVIDGMLIIMSGGRTAPNCSASKSKEFMNSPPSGETLDQLTPFKKALKDKETMSEDAIPMPLHVPVPMAYISAFLSVDSPPSGEMLDQLTPFKKALKDKETMSVDAFPMLLHVPVLMGGSLEVEACELRIRNETEDGLANAPAMEEVRFERFNGSGRFNNSVQQVRLNRTKQRFPIEPVEGRYQGQCKIEPDLISALVERWRPETHTFHLLCGESMITLEDVSMHLGLPVDRDVISGIAFDSWTTLCRKNLGRVSESFIGGRILLNWLDANFRELSADAYEDEVKMYARAYILQLIGGLLMLDKYRNLVHCMEMCRAIDYRRNAIGGCLLLLQSWAWYRLPFLCPVVNNSFIFPQLLRWSTDRKSHQELPDDLEKIRVLIDQKAGTQFEWVPYSTDDVRAVIPPELRGPSDVWMAMVPLICYATVEWHSTDRVLRQFGCFQPIPDALRNMDELHSLDRRGKTYTDWLVRHHEWVVLWEDRHRRLPRRKPILLDLLSVAEEGYYEWFNSNGKPFLLLENARGQTFPRSRQRRDPTQHHRPPTRGRRAGASGSSSAAPAGPSQHLTQPYMMPPSPFHYQMPPPSPGFMTPPPPPSQMTPPGGYYGSMFADPTWGLYVGYLAGSASSPMVATQTPHVQFSHSAMFGFYEFSQFSQTSGIDDDDDDGDDDGSEESEPVIRRNPPRDRQPPPCGTHLRRKHR
ncbi:hypothetical protein F3Y22_tig00001478pilonHSYRG00093 [Hibiscus syriacus]|uniref:Aminotransferase-like plant mobile domain-containing protein n=1 Tax=Hibiscus syriacus TaxID=106335 RepID=A0A6A3D0Z8_HIBSY|nr:hypothetical protein F3Y22_tig00001478pilonHSYRG00093 [Hibiscus syriacus]